MLVARSAREQLCKSELGEGTADNAQHSSATVVVLPQFTRM
jgi:hypothetical protein